MAITLYYVPGINRLDEPVFDDAQSQSDFFTRFKVSYADTGFYPPHYRNQIILSTDNISFTSAVNYLSLDYGAKTYYYFIDNITYVSEVDIKLDITMDVIQTYMFNMNFISSEQTRKSIQRWTASSTINRSYFRENFSNGIYENLSASYKLNTTKAVCLVAKFSSLPNTYQYLQDDSTTPVGTADNLPTAKLIYNDKMFPDGCVYMLIPLPFDNTYQGLKIYFINNTSKVIELGDLCDQLRITMEMPELISLTVVNGELFKTIGYDLGEETVTGVGKCLTISPGTTMAGTDYRYTEIGTTSLITPPWYVYCQGFITEYLPKAYYSSSYSFVFSRNMSKTATFDKKYCPVLIDENYFQVLWGERTGFTGYPIHLLTRKELYYKCIINPQNGSRDYWCANYTDRSTIDVKSSDYYLTLIRNSTTEYLPTYNDAYKTYMSQNYSSMTRGYGLKTQQNIYTAITGTTDIGDETAYGMISSYPNYAKMGAHLGHGIYSQLKLFADTAESQYAINEKRGITVSNLQHTPDTQSMANVAEFDFLDASIFPIFIIRQCTNITECAEKFESFGYKVDDIITSNPLTQHIRYYYDVVQAKNIVLALTGVINDETTITLIKQRIENGLRLWHTFKDSNNKIKTTIEDQGYNIGNVCILDNVEASLV